MIRANYGHIEISNAIQAWLCLLQGTNCSLSQCRVGREKPLKVTGHWSCTTNQHSTGTKPVICGTTQQEPREAEQHMHGQDWSYSRSTRRLKKDQMLFLFSRRTEGILLRYWSVLNQKLCLKSSLADRKWLSCIMQYFSSRLIKQSLL